MDLEDKTKDLELKEKLTKRMYRNYESAKRGFKIGTITMITGLGILIYGFVKNKEIPFYMGAGATLIGFSIRKVCRDDTNKYIYIANAKFPE